MSSKAIFKGCHVFILVGYSICTIVFSIIAYKRISENVSDSLDIFNNWQRGPIIELNVSDTHPNGFEELFNYTWPGIDSGCDCRNILQSSRSFFKVKETTSHVSCSPSDRLAGCLDIPSAAPLNLNTWTKLNNKKVQVYALRSSNETWADVAVKSGDNCTEPNARKCGKSTNNVFCTMRDKCPITGISIDTVDMLSPRIAECAMEEDCWVLGNGTYGVKLLSALRGDDDDALPLVDVTVNEYAMCHTLDETNISPGRSDYEWQKSKRSTCDSSSQLWTTVDTITEKEFFDLNGLSTIIGKYNRSSYYAPGHNGMDYHWGVFARTYIPWNTQCRSRMDALIHESSKLQKLKVAQVLQLVFASILGFILGIVLSCMICADSTSAFVKVFNWVGKLLLVPFVLVSLLTAASISKFLSDEALDGCSDEGIVAVLTNMGVGAAAAYTNNLRTIITIGVALFLDLVLMICKRAQGEEEPYHPQVNIEVQGKY